MSSYIYESEPAVGLRHYVMTAETDDHWFNFYAGKLAKYQNDYADDFCLVVNGSTTEDDAYVLPFAEFSDFFSKDYLAPRTMRWVGHIVGERIILNRTGKPPKKSA